MAIGSQSTVTDRWLLFGTAVTFVVTSVLFGLERGLAFSVLFGVFTAVLQSKWESRREIRVWGVLLIFLIAHVVGILMINIKSVGAGAVVVPIAMIDGFAIYGFINWLERRYKRY